MYLFSAAPEVRPDRYSPFEEPLEYHASVAGGKHEDDDDAPASTPSPAAIAAAREIHSPLADIEAVRRTAAIIDRHFPAQSQAQGEK